MALLATSPAGLQQQLHILEQFCADRGLTVNLKKTKVLLLAGGEDEEDAMAIARAAGLTYAGGTIEAVSHFKYLGVIFHCVQPLGECAAEGRASVARFAAAMFEGRCSELGLEATRLLLLLYDQMVDSTLSYAAAVWAPGLALEAVRRPVTGGGGSAAERQHHTSLRRLLGLPLRAPIATILAESGQPPLHVMWLVRAARLWSSIVAAPAGSIMRQVLDASLQLAADCQAETRRPAHMPWAAQLQAALTEAGLDFDPQQKAPLQPAAVRRAALQHHLTKVAAAAQRPLASQLRHYFVVVRPSCLNPDEYSMPAYFTEVRERRRRIALTELRTGVHWGLEAMARLLGANRPAADQRFCPHCAAKGLPGRVEDTRHILFDCMLYDDLRATFSSLFPAGQPQQVDPSLGEFLAGPPTPLACFTGACRRRARRVLGLPP
jgi:hypothetical protein